jgi:membrane-associated phospholipid phosphatase
MTARNSRSTTGRNSSRWPEVRRAAVLLVLGGVLVWLLMCGVGYLLTHPLTEAGFTHWEGGLDRWFAGHRTPGWNRVTNAASVAGDTPAAIGMSVLAFVVLRVVLHRWREALLLAVSMVGEVAIFAATAAIVGRHRPTVKHLDGSPPTSSFPSGHTAASTTLYGVLAVIVMIYAGRALWRALAVTLAGLIVVSIGLSRLYRGMHYPSDVAGGILLGLLWITVTSLVILHGHRSHAALSATAHR